jgi:tight adherence protein B
MTEFALIFAALLAVLILIWAALGAGRGREKRIRARAHRIARGARGAGAVSKSHDLRRADPDAQGVLNALAKRWVPNVTALQARLRKTGKAVSVGRYAAACLVLFAAALAAGLALRLPSVVALGFAVAVGAGLPHMAVSVMIARRRAAFGGHFPDAIDLMVRGLRSGLPITETVAACGREMPDPVGHEFRGIAHAVRAGRQLEEALWTAADRIDTAEFRFFVVALSVQRETGGNLAETLANLSTILRARKQMRLKISAMSGEAKASATILGSLPFVMFGIIYALNSGYIEPLFDDPRGRVMLAGGVGVMATGIAVMRKMIRFEI